MNFNFESPYIEDELEEIPYSLYEIHGVTKIKELSQQFQTLQNFRVATMQYRFRPRNNTYLEKKDEKYRVSIKIFKKSYSKFIKILQKIKRENISLENILKELLKSAIILEDKRSRTLFSSLKDTTEEFFISLHILSEQEMYLHPKRLKSVVKYTIDACKVNKIIKGWASKYYEELQLNYLQLDKELFILIPETQPEEINLKVLEEG